MSIIRVVISATILGQKVQNVLHFNNPDGALNNLAVKDELVGNFIPVLQNLQNNGLSYASLSVQQLTPLQPIEVFSITGAGTGSLAGAPAHPSLCGLFSIRTGTAGRRGHGRFYMFGVHGDSVSNGVVQSGAFGAYVNAATTLTGRYNATGTRPLQLGVCSRANPDDFKVMTALIARPTFGIQRRRNIGVGS